MLTFAISLLFTLGAAFAILVIVGMIVGNRAAIRSALAGHGAYDAAEHGPGTSPHAARVTVGRIRAGQAASCAAPPRSARYALPPDLCKAGDTDRQHRHIDKADQGKQVPRGKEQC